MNYYILYRDINDKQILYSVQHYSCLVLGLNNYKLQFFLNLLDLCAIFILCHVQTKNTNFAKIGWSKALLYNYHSYFFFLFHSF